MTMSALIIDATLWGSVLVLGFIAFRRGRVVVVSAAREGAMDFINIVPRIALGVIGSAICRGHSARGHHWLAGPGFPAGSASSPP